MMTAGSPRPKRVRSESIIPAIRTLIVEDEALYRELLTLALDNAPEVQVVGSAGTAIEALDRAIALKPEVILMDIEIGSDENGIALGLRLRQHLPSVGIVLLSNHNTRQYLQSIPQAEAAGWSYLLKRSVSNLGTLVRVIQAAALGLMVLDPMLNEFLTPRLGSRTARLTPRQLDVLKLVAEGHSNAAIAQKLFLSDKSVENHLTAVYQVLGVWMDDEPVHPRVKAVLVYLNETHDTSV